MKRLSKDRRKSVQWGGSRASTADDKRSVLVLGATGLVGGPVARALLSYPWFNVVVGTRRPWSSDALLLKRAGAKVVELDFNYKQSLYLAMVGVKCVFLHTHYWEHYSATLEVEQGRNAVEAAVEAEVEHVVYDGTCYTKPSEGRVCGFLASRLEIEKFIISTGISYTIVVLPFLLENLLTVFRPFEVSPDLFALPLPMESFRLPVAGMNDLAMCLCKVILHSSEFHGHKVRLSGEMLTVSQMVSHFNLHIRGKTFFNPEMTVQDFMSFEFPGAKDLALMFLYYQQDDALPDLLHTKTLHPRMRDMAKWISDNYIQFLRVLSEPAETGSIESFVSECSRSSTSSQLSSLSLSASSTADIPKVKAGRHFLVSVTPSDSDVRTKFNKAKPWMGQQLETATGLSAIRSARNIPRPNSGVKLVPTVSTTPSHHENIRRDRHSKEAASRTSISDKDNICPPVANLPLPSAAHLPLPPVAKLPRPPADHLPLPPVDHLPLPPADHLPLPPADDLPPADHLPLPPADDLPPADHLPLPPADHLPRPPADHLPPADDLPPADHLPRPPADHLPLPPADHLPQE